MDFILPPNWTHFSELKSSRSETNEITSRTFSNWLGQTNINKSTDSLLALLDLISVDQTHCPTIHRGSIRCRSSPVLSTCERQINDNDAVEKSDRWYVATVGLLDVCTKDVELQVLKERNPCVRLMSPHELCDFATWHVSNARWNHSFAAAKIGIAASCVLLPLFALSSPILPRYAQTMNTSNKWIIVKPWSEDFVMYCFTNQAERKTGLPTTRLPPLATYDNYKRSQELFPVCCFDLAFSRQIMPSLSYINKNQ